MASPHPPLPPGVSPVAAGRIGLWLLGKRQHRAAIRRVAFPHRDNVGTTFVIRFVRLILPWRVWEYPGETRYLAALLGIAESYAHNLMKPSVRLPSKHALRLADSLSNHASQCEALAAELRAYAAAENNRKFTNKGIDGRKRDRI